MEFTILVVTLIVLMVIGVPIAFALAGAALLNIVLFHGIEMLEFIAVPVMFHSIDNFLLAAVPLFLLMGLIMQRGGISDVLYNCASVWLRHIPGGLGVATTASCAVFAALCGSSPATAATIGSASIPAMIKRGYPPRFTYGLIAAGGTLGILIPPSISMVVYGAISGESVGRLFLAGVVPGILLALVFATYAYLRALKGDVAVEPKASWRERGQRTFAATGALAMSPIILGGIYFGVFTPTEAAAIGVLLALLLALAGYRAMRARELPQVLYLTARTTCVMLLIVAGASVFSHLVTLQRVPQIVAGYVADGNVPTWAFWAVIVVMVTILGCFLEAAAILYLVVPVVAPVLAVLDIDHAHFCIVMVMLIELGMITPPVGMNLFVIMSITKGATLADVVKGSVPFVFLLVASTIVVIALPDLSVWLPNALED